MSPEFHFACPSCRSGLEAIDSQQLSCRTCRQDYFQVDGIWRMLAPGRAEHFQRFVREYETVRQAEGRGSADAAYYRQLPFKDLSGRFSADWAVRAASYRSLLRQVLAPLEKRHAHPLKILDMGAGNGWLSNRLAQRGHIVAAVDLLTNYLDGLGAYIHYPVAFTPLQAEFDRLPLLPGEAHLLIFNASLHYSGDYLLTLQEALRVLADGGRLVILDTPLYSDPQSGRLMVQERQAGFIQQHGFSSNALGSEEFLTYNRLDELARKLDVSWQIHTPYYGLRWMLRPLKAGLLRRREPARFQLVSAQKP